MYVGPAKSLLTKQDVDDILNSSYFYETNKISIVEEKGYDTDPKDIPYVEFMKQVKAAYDSGKTIVVKGLENYNEKIASYCRWLGVGVDAHMYVTPRDGTTFGWHRDDTDVIVQRVYGDKKLLIQRDGFELPYEISDLHGIFIRQGELHKAIPIGESCIISVGIPMNVQVRRKWL